MRALPAIGVVILAAGAVAPFAVAHYDAALAADTSLLASTALVMGGSGIPTPPSSYVDAVDDLYLKPLGFDGHAISLATPEWASHWDASVSQGVEDLVNAVHTQMATGDVDAADPLWIFGYSQSAVVASIAMQQLADEGIAQDDLHFVLVGDTASAHGGFLNTFVASLPESWQSFAIQVLERLDAGSLIGVTTPADLYPTDVYTIAGDGWADWPQQLRLSDLWTALCGQLVQHFEYLGLDPSIIASATQETDGLVNYFTVPTDNIDVLSTLWNAFLAVAGFG